jgi:hypothetical protein
VFRRRRPGREGHRRSYLASLRDAARAGIETAAGRRWFEATRQRQEALGRFATVEVLLEFFDHRPGTEGAFAERDAILRALLDEHRAGPEPRRTHDLFLLIYYPLLVHLAREFGPDAKGHSLDEDDTAPEILHAFFHLLATLNPDTNRDIHTSLANGTRRDFLRWAGPEFEAANETSASPEWEGDEEPPALAAPDLTYQDLVAGPARAAGGGGWELDAAELLFDELRRREVIDETIHRLLVGTVVYGRQLKQLVTTPGPSGKALGYEAAKKRVQRAQAEIRRYLADRDVEDLLRAAARSADRDVPSREDPGSGASKAGTEPGEEPDG